MNKSPNLKYDYFVYNRNTGRDIRVNSKTYEKYINQGIKFDKPFLKLIKKDKLYNETKGLPLYSGDISKVSSNMIYDSLPLYISSKNWSLLSPKKGNERNKMFQKCGSKCFLNPTKKGFPICPYDRENDEPICEVSCKGLMAAKKRSAQWKYKDIYNTSTELFNSKCNK